MNSTNVKALWLFTSQENCEFLYKKLVRYWNDPRATKAIYLNLPAWMQHFAAKLRRELMYTESVEHDVQGVLNAANDRFLGEMIEFISKNVLFEQERAGLTNGSVYNWNDGRNVKAQSIIARLPRTVVNDRDSHTTSTRMVQPRTTRIPADKNNEQKSTMDVLDSWRYPYHGRNVRDDIPGDTDTDGCDVSSVSRANVVTGDGFYFQGVEQDTNNVQAVKENTSYAIETMMNDPMIQLLNRRDDKYGTSDAQPQSDVRLWTEAWNPVDDSDPVQEKHYMERRVMRSYNVAGRVDPRNIGKNGVPVGGIRTDDSADAQIPFWRKTVQHRHVDYTAKDALSGYVERGNMQHGFPMNDLICRVEDNRRTHQAGGVKPFSFDCE